MTKAQAFGNHADFLRILYTEILHQGSITDVMAIFYPASTLSQGTGFLLLGFDGRDYHIIDNETVGNKARDLQPSPANVIRMDKKKKTVMHVIDTSAAANTEFTTEKQRWDAATASLLQPHQYIELFGW